MDFWSRILIILHKDRSNKHKNMLLGKEEPEEPQKSVCFRLLSGPAAVACLAPSAVCLVTEFIAAPVIFMVVVVCKSKNKRTL